jgi:hypothetical protein
MTKSTWRDDLRWPPSNRNGGRDQIGIGGRDRRNLQGVALDPSAFTNLAANLSAACHAPGVTMRARQQLLRTLITDIIVDVDEDAREVILTCSTFGKLAMDRVKTWQQVYDFWFPGTDGLDDPDIHRELFSWWFEGGSNGELAQFAETLAAARNCELDDWLRSPW